MTDSDHLYHWEWRSVKEGKALVLKENWLGVLPVLIGLGQECIPVKLHIFK